jgi:hypothetical protein
MCWKREAEALCYGGVENNQDDERHCTSREVMKTREGAASGSVKR